MTLDIMKFLLLLCLAVPAFCLRVDSSITGGTDANIEDFSHQLSLREFDEHSCGASLIAVDKAVTAAHCTAQSATFYSIVGGTSDYTVNTCSTCVTRNVDWINRHPSFTQNGGGYQNDIAVVGITPVIPNINLQPITLANSENETFVQDLCTITGWGSTSSSSGLSNILQQVTGTILSNQECAVTWGVLDIDAGHICFYEPTSSICDGDGGGPLTCPSNNGNYPVLAGAASWGEVSCDPSYPSVFTRISFYYSWIIQQ